jgi:hypothetical protein
MSSKFNKCCCRSKNIKQAERLADLFVARNFAALIAATQNVGTVIISGAPADPPEFPNPVPPYSGTYTSNAQATAVQQALTAYGSFVVPQVLIKGDTLFNCGFSRVTIEISTTSIYSCFPGNPPPGPFSDPITVMFAFNFFFDRCGNLTSITITAENAEIVRYYLTGCPPV